MIKRQPIRKNARLDEDVKEGAWKLAYADFVTAMMCFFMLMWLLNATPSEKLKSMAIYFKPTISFFSYSANSQKTDGKENKDQTYSSDSSTIESASQSDVLMNTQLSLNTELESDISTKALIDSIDMELNKNGLEIVLFNNNTRSMFKKNSAELTNDAEMILSKIVKSIAYLPNRIIISGHTEQMNNNLINGYNSWDLSAARAINAIKFMNMSGLPDERVIKLNAYSDNSPLDSQNPRAEQNNRITITILANQLEADNYKDPISKKALILDK